MSSEEGPIEVEPAPYFQRRIRTLAKRYRSIRQDVEPVITQLQAGNLLGDQVQGTGYALFKVRISNSDIKKGKRAGYRLIY
ncbi:MAG: hypothetical protein AAFR99_11220 [Cyanobacteria bacterium J06629_9]